MKTTNNNRKTSKDKMQNVNGISAPTRKWLVALGMIQDILEYCRRSYDELREEGYPVKNHDNEILEATKNMRTVINKYLTEQIYMSMLDFGSDKVEETNRI